MSGKRVVEFRQRRKQWAVEAFGGKCGICGYDKCVEALEFHHINPNEKDFSPSASVANREVYVGELRKCVCVCSNCHREVHAGITSIPSNIDRFNENFYLKPLPEKPKHPCKQCGKLTNTKNIFCSVKCSSKNRETIEWPTDEQLKVLVEKNGYTATGRIFGVSDNAVRKRLKSKKLL